MHKALYRKYRPNNFDEVVGQDNVVKTLKNSVKNKSFSHAYMFFGPRGVGKTTLSKIFAKSINCLNTLDGNPCGECESCKIVDNSVDIIEMDAASNNGVDEIRNIIDKIMLAPSELKYKVYIIDEVHMLSMGAFNALLKTLEEPPEYTVFILATTDPQKVPETIISRCQTFSLNRLNISSIVDNLKSICEREKIDITEEVLYEIASISDGGMRDALGMLDKLSSYSDDKITIDVYAEMNGFITNKDMQELSSYIFLGNISSFIKMSDSLNSKGKDFIQILNQYIKYLRNLIVDKYLNNSEIKYPIANLEKLLKVLNEKTFDIKKSGNPKIYIEMIIIDFINNYCDKSIVYNQKNDEEVKTVEEISFDMSSEKISNSNDDSSKTLEDESNKKDEVSVSSIHSDIAKNKIIVNINDIMRARITNLMLDANKNKLIDFKKKLHILENYKFDKEYSYIITNLQDAELRVASDNGLLFSYKTIGLLKSTLDNILLVTDVFNNIFGTNYSLAFMTDSEWNQLKNRYIELHKQNISFERIEEPEIIFEKSDIIDSSPIDIFGDEVIEEVD